MIAIKQELVSEKKTAMLLPSVMRVLCYKYLDLNSLNLVLTSLSKSERSTLLKCQRLISQAREDPLEIRLSVPTTQNANLHHA